MKIAGERYFYPPKKLNFQVKELLSDEPLERLLKVTEGES
jgi:hypothetical protein